MVPTPSASLRAGAAWFSVLWWKSEELLLKACMNTVRACMHLLQGSVISVSSELTAQCGRNKASWYHAVCKLCEDGGESLLWTQSVFIFLFFMKSATINKVPHLSVHAFQVFTLNLVVYARLKWRIYFYKIKHFWKYWNPAVNVSRSYHILNLNNFTTGSPWWPYWQYQREFGR